MAMAATLGASRCCGRRRARAPRRATTWRLAKVALCALALAGVSVESIVTRDDAASATTVASISPAPTYPPVTSAAPSSSSPISHAPAPTAFAAAVEAQLRAAETLVSTAFGAASSSSSATNEAATTDEAQGDRAHSSSGNADMQSSESSAPVQLAARANAEASGVDADAALPTAPAPVTATQPLAPLGPPPVASSSASPASGRATVQVTELVADEGRGGGTSRGDYTEDDAFDSIDLPSSLFEIEDKDSGGRRQNYASLDAGATILDSSPETKSPTNLLVPDKDRYMLIPCEKPRKWVVVSLSEDVHADAIAIANYEKYSSPVRAFIVLGSVTYPTDTWFVLGNFTAAPTNGEQVFQLDSQYHVRYIKLRFFSHYGSEYYCTLSQLKVFGRTFTQVISQLEKSIDAEAALEAVALPSPPASGHAGSSGSPLPSPAPSAGAGVMPTEPTAPARSKTDDVASLPASADTSTSGAQCELVAPPPTNSTALYSESQLAQYRFTHGSCRLDEFDRGAARPGAGLDPLATPPVAPPAPGGQSGGSSSSSSSLAAKTVSTPGAATGGSSDTKANGTAAATGADSASGHAIGGNITPTVTAPVATSSSTLAASTQGLGRLESIFVRITKKIQALEHNQSAFGRQLDDFQAQQRVATRTLQATQETFAEQLDEIRSLLTDLKGTVRTELATTEKTLSRYGRVLEDVQRENIALWNEMLLVREVITTMKAGILCAIVLSALIIAFYLLRLLFRCVAACKQRADLREWFWRMENEASSSSSATTTTNAKDAASSPLIAAKLSRSGGAASPGSDVGAGSLRVNRKQQFGSSWDDSAIERKTLMSDMVDGPQKFRRHRTKKSRTASLTYGPTIQRIGK